MATRKEYIERGALEEKLNRRLEQLRKEYGNYDHYTDGFDEAVDIVEAEPTAADVVEVVRCEKCKFYEIVEYWHPDCNGTKQVCRLLKRQMQEDDFCSYGERKDGADNG